MRTASRILALLLSIAPQGILQGQSSSLRFAAGAGLLAADRGLDNYSNRLGTTAFLRIRSPGQPLLLEASMQHVPRNTNIADAAVRASTAFTLTPAAQVTWRWPEAAWLFRFGPSFHWFVERQLGSDPLAIGLRAGTSVRPGHTQSGLLLSADYFRLIRGGSSPRWFLPITLGWEF